MRKIKYLALLLFAAAAALGQNPNTSPFPGALDSDSTLYVSQDNVKTTLNGAVTATAVTITVSDSTNLVAFPTSCWAGFEIFKISGKAGNDLTVPTDCVSGTCPTCSPTTTCRGWGFPSTIETAHSDNDVFTCGPTAERGNAIAAAIVEIQTALGINLENVGGQITCDSPTTLTIAAGLVAIPSSGCYLIETESMAPTDDLDTVTCAVAVHFIFMPASGARTVVVRDNGSNMDLPGSFALDDEKDQFFGRCDTSNFIIEKGRVHIP